jgi:hypothetical protein
LVELKEKDHIILFAFNQGVKRTLKSSRHRTNHVKISKET